MSNSVVLEIGRELIVTALMLSLPTIAISLVVGLVISILQTITSVQEQTLTFAPRIMAVGIGLVVTMPWSLTVLTNFTHRMMWYVAQAGH
jgi:flagellar biosynthesis protein FliQ